MIEGQTRPKEKRNRKGMNVENEKNQKVLFKLNFLKLSICNKIYRISSEYKRIL